VLFEFNVSRVTLNKFPLDLPATPTSPTSPTSPRTQGSGRRSSNKGKDSEYENMESDNEALNMSRDSEQREMDEFEEEERKLLAEEDQKTTPGLAFALPGRWTGGKREEEEMRRLLAAQHELHGGETSQSDWSEDDEAREAAETTDDGGLDQLSMAANGALTDVEGAMSDVNSLYEGGEIVGDMDDTSLSSRASSRIFDSDQIYSADSLHGMYDSEYDNCRGTSNLISDAESDFNQEDDSDMGVLDELSLEHIRQISQNITSKFGTTASEKESEGEGT